MGPGRRSKGWPWRACRSLVRTHRRGAAGPDPEPPYSQTCSSTAASLLLFWEWLYKAETEACLWLKLNALPGPGVPCLSAYLYFFLSVCLSICLLLPCDHTTCLSKLLSLVGQNILFPPRKLNLLFPQITCSPHCTASPAVTDLSSPLAGSLGLSHSTTGTANYLHAPSAQKQEVGSGKNKREGRNARGGVDLLSDWPRTKLSPPSLVSPSSLPNLPLHISYPANENKHSLPPPPTKK